MDHLQNNILQNNFYLTKIINSKNITTDIASITHIYNRGCIFKCGPTKGKLNTLRHWPRIGGKILVSSRKTVISFLFKYLKKMHLDFMLKRVGVFRKFNVKGKLMKCRTWSVWVVWIPYYMKLRRHEIKAHLIKAHLIKAIWG